MSILDGFFSLGRDINKADEEHLEKKEGILSDKQDELTLSIKDEELIQRKKDWTHKWENSKVKSELEVKMEDNENYWLGDHYDNQAQKNQRKRPLMDNMVFEAFEIFLANVTKQNPEPLTASEDRSFAEQVKKILVHLADLLKLKLKVRTVVRHWGLYYLGVLQIGWSNENNEIDFMPQRPQKLILDPDATVVGGEYKGEFLGKHRTETAGDLVKRFPDKSSLIKEKVDKKMGTKIGYIEWWTEEMLFWTLGDEVLQKVKNPHWNWKVEEEKPKTKEVIDDFGNAMEVEVRDEEGNLETETFVRQRPNHFNSPKIPFAFLSVFNLGKGPHDDTTLVEQVLSLQDAINKRIRQIDKNADNTNAGAVVSGDVFTKEQAAQVGKALRKGQTVWVPSGDVSKSYKREQGPALPTFVFDSLLDLRQRLRAVFGITGLSAEGIRNTETARGKIIVRGQDTDRSSPIVEFIEQFYDYVFNWATQLIYVYYDEDKASKIAGAESEAEIIKITQNQLENDVLVSVKDGSLIPKDDLTQRNEAIDLWGANALDPITLFERLDFPNPKESAKNLFLWQRDPAKLFQDEPEIQQMMQEQAQAQAMEQGGQVPQEEVAEEEQPVQLPPLQ